MKHFYIFTLLILIYSCNGGAQLNNKLVGTTEWMPQPATDNINILGSWKMCAEFTDGQICKLNECQTIIFNADGSGSSVSPGTAKESFCWSLKNNLLKVYYISTDGGKTFPDTNYLAGFRDEKEGLELEILHKKKDLLMLLQREQ